jgi:hypothetical protein
MVYASDAGVSTGTNDIPAYRTTQGNKIVRPGEQFIISLSHFDKYNYTKLQCVITKYNTSINNSMATDKVVIDNSVYNVGSPEILSNVTKDVNLKSINLNIVNNSDNIYIIRYFTYKEEE